MDHYSSFREIDNQLRILRLQREISLEQLNTKRQSLKSYFQLPSLREELFDGLKRSAILVITTFVLGKLRKRIARKAREV